MKVGITTQMSDAFLFAAVSKESRRLWKNLPKVPAEGPDNLEDAKQLLEFLYENPAEDLYLRDVMSNYSWKKQVRAKRNAGKTICL